jgi:hypothetical protein
LLVEANCRFKEEDNKKHGLLPHFVSTLFSFKIGVVCNIVKWKLSLRYAETISVADPDPGYGAFFTPGSGIRDG